MLQTDAPLTAALESLRARGLELRRASDPVSMPEHARPSVPTGHPRLDAALGTNGWPRGALVMIDAPRGAGATSLALGTLAAAQVAGGLAAWLDLERTFDPAVAAATGIDLEWLLIGRPHDAAEAIDLAAWLGRTGLIDVLVLDLGARGAPDRRALDRLGSLLARSSSTAVLVLAGVGRVALASVAGVRVALHRSAWLAVGRDLVGQRVTASVERHRWALAGGSAELDLWFEEGRRIDSVLTAAAEPRSDPARSELQAVSA